MPGNALQQEGIALWLGAMQIKQVEPANWGLDRGPQTHRRLKIRLPLVPPNPKELDSA